tara:strand:- start:402 stop:824 length:423 start_codon:yes stop_codon:yes gene_type:complete
MHSSLKNDTTYKVIKLINGETIIASLTSDDVNDIEVQEPLLMTVEMPDVDSNDGESLNLSRWIEPHTEQKYFKITKSSIVTTAVASIGLSSYYEYFIDKLHAWQDDNDEFDLKTYEEDYTDEEIYEDLLNSLEAISKAIH